MKGSRLWITVGFVVVLALGIGAAFFFGEKSPLVFSGTVRLAPHLTAPAQGVRTLYLVLYPTDAPRPYAAMRVQLTADPLETVANLVVTPERLQIMQPGAPIPMQFHVKVRLDRDGMGGTDQPGDLVGMVHGVTRGTEGLELVIDQLVPGVEDVGQGTAGP